MNTQIEIEAIGWLVRFMELAADGKREELDEAKPEFEQWVTRSPEHVKAWVDTYAIYMALGECESELVGKLEAVIDERGNIVSFGPAKG